MFPFKSYTYSTSLYALLHQQSYTNSLHPKFQTNSCNPVGRGGGGGGHLKEQPVMVLRGKRIGERLLGSLEHSPPSETPSTVI